MRELPLLFAQPVHVAAAPNQVIHVNLVDAPPFWVVPPSAMGQAKLELVVLDDGGAELHRFPIAGSADAAHVDLSAVDPDRPVRVEVRREDVCILPPVEVAIGALRRHAAVDDLPTDQRFVSATAIRSPP